MALRFTLRQLEYFFAVGETGSIAKAAERINVSSSSISAAISQLEQEFGIQLFIRQHTQRLSLTQGGRRFMKQTSLLFDQADALHELASDIAEQARGPITIGCLVTLAPLILASIRRSFEAACPEARVTHTEAHQTRLIDMLRLADVDVAITYDLDLPQDMAFEPLAALPPSVLIAPDHPWASCNALRLEDLHEEPMVPLKGDYRPVMLGLAMIRSGSQTRIVQAFCEHCRTIVSDSSIPGMAPPRPGVFSCQTGAGWRRPAGNMLWPTDQTAMGWSWCL